MKGNILLLNDALHAGGVERVLQVLAADLVQSGASVTLWAPRGNREALAKYYPAGIRFRRYPFWERERRRYSPGWFCQKACQLLFEGFLLRLKKWDAVIAVKEGPSMRLAARLRAKKKLAWVHTDYSTLHWTHWFFRCDEAERQCMASLDAVVCVSETVRRSIIESVGDPGNLCVRYNPIDAAGIVQKAAAPAADAKRPGDRPLFAAVGRLDKGKRFDLLIDVCRELSQAFAFELWIIGGGEEEAALREQLKRDGVGCVRLLGPRDNPYPYISRADWLISASESESYGLTVQEALILDVPVLACACGGIAESLDSRCGKLVGLERQALLEGLRGILEDPSQTEEYRRRIRRFYDKDALWEPRLEAIRRLIHE